MANKEVERIAKQLHSDLLDDISRDLVTREVRQIKQRLRNEEFGGFRAREIEEMEDIESIFTAQQKRKVFYVGNYIRLKEQLEKIKRHELVDIVQDYEEKLRNIGYPVMVSEEQGAAGQASTSTNSSVMDPVDSTNDQKEKFRKFLLELSTQYDGLNYKWLRFLLYDHLSIDLLGKGDIKAMTLFNELKVKGHISCTNVIILSEIAELTQLVSAKLCIAGYKGTTQCREGGVLSQYRKTLFRALREVAESELQTLISSYQLDHFQAKFNDVWDLVFDLEQAKHLDVKKQKWEDFANLLNGRAKGIMIRDMRLVFEC